MDYVSRQNALNRFPRVMARWLNRKLTSAFTKWVKVARSVREVEWRRRSLCLCARLLLRNKAKRVVLDAFNKLRVRGGGGGGRGDGSDGEQGRRENDGRDGNGGFGGGGGGGNVGYWNQSITWTEVPPSPFM